MELSADVSETASASIIKDWKVGWRSNSFYKPTCYLPITHSLGEPRLFVRKLVKWRRVGGFGPQKLQILHVDSVTDWHKKNYALPVSYNGIPSWESNRVLPNEKQWCWPVLCVIDIRLAEPVRNIMAQCREPISVAPLGLVRRRSQRHVGLVSLQAVAQGSSFRVVQH